MRSALYVSALMLGGVGWMAGRETPHRAQYYTIDGATYQWQQNGNYSFGWSTPPVPCEMQNRDYYSWYTHAPRYNTGFGWSGQEMISPRAQTPTYQPVRQPQSSYMVRF